MLGRAAFGTVILILSGYALSTTNVIRFGPMLAVGLCVVLIVHGAAMRRLRRTESDPRILVWLLLLIGILLAAAFDQGTSPLASAVALASFATCGFLVTLNVDRRRFMEDTVAAMDIIALVAIVATIVVVLGGIHVPLGRIENINGVTYLNGYVFFFIEANGTLLPRALGVFWEPGLLASFLVLASLIELTLKEDTPSRRRLALYATAIVFTQSTAGLLLVIPVALVAMFRKRRRRAGLAFTATLIGFVVLYYRAGDILRSLSLYQPLAFGKLDEGGLFNETRWNALLLNLSIFARSPYVGAGASGASEAFSSSMNDTVRAQTTTSAFFLAALGVLGAVYTVAWIWGVLRLRHMTVYSRLWFMVCVLIIVNKEPHMAILFTYCLLFYLLGWKASPLEPAKDRAVVNAQGAAGVLGTQRPRAIVQL